MTHEEEATAILSTINSVDAEIVKVVAEALAHRDKLFDAALHSAAILGLRSAKEIYRHTSSDGDFYDAVDAKIAAIERGEKDQWK